MIEAKLLTTNPNEEWFSTLVESDFLFNINFNFNYWTYKMIQNLTLTLKLKLKLKLNPNFDHFYVVKTQRLGLSDDSVTYFDNKHDERVSYPDFWFFGGF